jgi:hypothetical protein
MEDSADTFFDACPCCIFQGRAQGVVAGEVKYFGMWRF